MYTLYILTLISFGNKEKIIDLHNSDIDITYIVSGFFFTDQLCPPNSGSADSDRLTGLFTTCSLYQDP